MDEKRSKELADDALDAVSGGGSLEETREKLNSMINGVSGTEIPFSPLEERTKLTLSPPSQSIMEPSQPNPVIEATKDFENPGTRLF